ncbi:MAG: family 43 glycosylhydrolase [bacterium]
MLGKDSILIYTRKPIEDSYSSYLAYSVHLAHSSDNLNYKALNQNYGILFASASIDENNVIKAKGLKNPYIFNTSEGNFAIIAVRINADGSRDDESKGKVLLWTSKDLIHFEEKGLLDLNKEAYVEQVTCQYNTDIEKYQIDWCDEEGNSYRNTMDDLSDKNSISSVKAIRKSPLLLKRDMSKLSVPEGAVKSNVISIESDLREKLQLKWSSLENISLEIPESVLVNTRDDINAVKARAIYSDGSTAIKKVQWDIKNIDFSVAGTYEIRGKVVQEKFDFPLAVGYADPVITKWNGKYYFIATNDNVNDIGLFVREANSVSALFEEGVKEYLILDKDESRGLVQTFWAPEFHLINGEMYILFAVSGSEWGPQSHIMKLKKGGEITDPDSWTDPIRVVKEDGSNLTNDGITLDMTYFEAGKTSYYVWSYRYGIGTAKDTGSMLYIASVDPAKPWQLTSDPVLLSRPLYGWENIDGTINNEGPYPLITDNYVYICYSGGNAIGYTYAIGTLKIDKNDNMLDPDNWLKSSTPVLSYYSIENKYGPGHNAFYKNDNGDLMITYHAEPTMKDSMRCTAIHRVHFDINNLPRFDMSSERDLKSEFAEVVTRVIIQERENIKESTD